ncbi:MAG: hypothetical protein NVSMB2_03260 [Chloroflexota bacterium]
MRTSEGVAVFPRAPKTATGTLAAFAAEYPAASLPAEILSAGRRLTIDTLGVALAAVVLPQAQQILMEVSSWGGTPEATLLGTNTRTSTVQAAYANSYLANLLDADETLLNYAHIANAIVPSALAVAERVGATGKELLSAVAIGYEVAARIGAAYRSWSLVDDQPEWSPVAGYSWVIFGVTAAAGRLLQLTTDQMTSAFGIAGYSATAPSIGKWVDSTERLPHTKYVFLGPLAHSGVASALLARRGFLGDDDVLDGDRGFWRIAGSDACDWDAMTGQLGTDWLVDQVSFKLYPTCRFMHGALDLFRDVLLQNELQPDEIEHVEVRLPQAATRPYFLNRSPAHVVEGSFSVSHAVACLAYRLPLGPQWHTDAELNRADLRAFRERVDVGVDPQAGPRVVQQLVGESKSYYRQCPTSITVQFRGQRLSRSTDNASGDPWDPTTFLDDAALEDKFVSYVAPLLGAGEARDLHARLHRLDEHEDVAILGLGDLQKEMVLVER